MVEEETQEGRKEAREKVVVEMEGYGNVTFGSEGIRPGEHIEREKKGKLAKGMWGSRGENEEEKGLAAGDRIVEAFGGGWRKRGRMISKQQK